MFTILVLLSRYKPLKKLYTTLFDGVFILVIIPAINYTEQFSSSTESIRFPYQYSNLLSDKSIQEYLNSKNYIQPYKLAYNFSGVFGAEYSVSRAPNTSDLRSRINKDLIIFCFTGDPACLTKTKKISNPELEAYGISEYESKLTTLEFYNLPIKEKFNYNLDSLGSDNRVIEEQFLGKNPYLK